MQEAVTVLRLARYCKRAAAGLRGVSAGDRISHDQRQSICSLAVYGTRKESGQSASGPALP